MLIIFVIIGCRIKGHLMKKGVSKTDYVIWAKDDARVPSAAPAGSRQKTTAAGTRAKGPAAEFRTSVR